MPEPTKDARLVRIASPVNELSSQAARDREAQGWVRRISREQRIWVLRSRGFFQMGAELGDDQR
jgi:hypothetical protein